MAEWSKALRSGRSPLLWAWVRIPLLTSIVFNLDKKVNGVGKDILPGLKLNLKKVKFN